MSLRIRIPSPQDVEEKQPQKFLTAAQIYNDPSTHDKQEKITAILIRSASIGDIATIQECLFHYRSFVDINAVDESNTSALVYACCMGYLDIVKLLLENGAHISHKEQKYIALLAISNGHFDIAQLLNMHTAKDDDEETLQEDVQLDSLDDVDIPQDFTRSFEQVHKQMDHVLTIAIQRILPSRKEFVPLGANVIFVHAKSLKYGGTEEVKTFLSNAVSMIREWVSLNSQDYTLCYWISNCLQLLVYLKKEEVWDTFEAQSQLTDLINDISKTYEGLCSSAVNNTIPKLVLHEKEKVNSIRYHDDHFFKTPKVMEEFFKYHHEPSISPAEVIQILDGIWKTCLATGLHNCIIIQFFTIICKKFSKGLFDHILSTNEICCRARARLIQQHLSEIIGWVREKELSLNKSSIILQHFLPCVQLLQFIQFVSMFYDLVAFKQLIHSVPTVHISKIKKLMSQYRFESGEQRFSQQIINYVVGITVEEKIDAFDDTLRLPLQPDSSPLWTREALIPTVIKEMLDQ